MRRNELLRRLPTAGLTTDLAQAELDNAKEVLIRAAVRLLDETSAGRHPSDAVVRYCAAAGTWVMRWQDALERVREIERRAGRA